MRRRTFLAAAPAAAAAASFAAPSVVLGRSLTFADWSRELAEYDALPADAAGDEDFWAAVGRAFTIDRSVVNLNNGGVSPSPTFVLDAVKRHMDWCNSTPPPVALFSALKPHVESVRTRLARAFGGDAEEIAITRNSSESLQVCQLGIDLKPGDEVLCCTQDYPRMLTTFEQRERRDGIVLRRLRLPIPAENEDEIVKQYEVSIRPKTRMILVSHIINITGQILPVKRIVEVARRAKSDAMPNGIPVIVDGAHALAHFDFRIPELGCDYYGVSLHKWLFAPHGTGLLYVRREKIGDLWPLMAAAEAQREDIRKFEEIGTHALAPKLAIAEAITFHEAIGGKRKEARLRFLKDTWAKRLLSHKSGRVRLHTSLKPAFSCGIGTFQVNGLDSAKLQSWLWETRQILVTPIKHAEFEGIRVTPSVYTTRDELDRFCEAVEHAIERGLPA